MNGVCVWRSTTHYRAIIAFITPKINHLSLTQKQEWSFGQTIFALRSEFCQEFPFFFCLQVSSTNHSTSADQNSRRMTSESEGKPARRKKSLLYSVFWAQKKFFGEHANRNNVESLAFLNKIGNQERANILKRLDHSQILQTPDNMQKMAFANLQDVQEIGWLAALVSTWSFRDCDVSYFAILVLGWVGLEGVAGKGNFPTRPFRFCPTN